MAQMLQKGTIPLPYVPPRVPNPFISLSKDTDKTRKGDMNNGFIPLPSSTKNYNPRDIKPVVLGSDAKVLNNRITEILNGQKELLTYIVTMSQGNEALRTENKIMKETISALQDQVTANTEELNELRTVLDQFKQIVENKQLPANQNSRIKSITTPVSQRTLPSPKMNIHKPIEKEVKEEKEEVKESKDKEELGENDTIDENNNNEINIDDECYDELNRLYELGKIAQRDGLKQGKQAFYYANPNLSLSDLSNLTPSQLNSLKDSTDKAMGRHDFTDEELVILNRNLGTIAEAIKLARQKPGNQTTKQPRKRPSYQPKKQ